MRVEILLDSLLFILASFVDCNIDHDDDEMM